MNLKRLKQEQQHRLVAVCPSQTARRGIATVGMILAAGCLILVLSAIPAIVAVQHGVVPPPAFSARIGGVGVVARVVEQLQCTPHGCAPEYRRCPTCDFYTIWLDVRVAHAEGSHKRFSGKFRIPLLGIVSWPARPARWPVV